MRHRKDTLLSSITRITAPYPHQIRGSNFHILPRYPRRSLNTHTNKETKRSTTTIQDNHILAVKHAQRKATYHASRLLSVNVPLHRTHRQPRTHQVLRPTSYRASEPAVPLAAHHDPFLHPRPQKAPTTTTLLAHAALHRRRPSTVLYDPHPSLGRSRASRPRRRPSWRRARPRVQQLPAPEIYPTTFPRGGSARLRGWPLQPRAGGGRRVRAAVLRQWARRRPRRCSR
jgi:hypothetical protein